MNSFDMEDLKGITYQQSMVAGAQIELEAMKLANRIRESHSRAPAYSEKDFMDLIDRYRLGHNDVLGNLHWSDR